MSSSGQGCLSLSQYRFKLTTLLVTVTYLLVCTSSTTAPLPATDASIARKSPAAKSPYHKPHPTPLRHLSPAQISPQNKPPTHHKPAPKTSPPHVPHVGNIQPPPEKSPPQSSTALHPPPKNSPPKSGTAHHPPLKKSPPKSGTHRPDIIISPNPPLPSPPHPSPPQPSPRHPSPPLPSPPHPKPPHPVPPYPSPPQPSPRHPSPPLPSPPHPVPPYPSPPQPSPPSPVSPTPPPPPLNPTMSPRPSLPPKPPRPSPSLPVIETFDIWILAGASNMVGDNAGYYNETWPPEANPIPNQILMFPQGVNQWIKAEANVGLASYNESNVHNSVGPEMCFSHALLNSSISTKVGLIPMALGGSILADGWTPPGFLYTNTIKMTEAAMAAAGPNAKLRGILFIEGEGTAMPMYNDPYPIAATWSSNFTTMVQGLRKDLAMYNPNLAVLLGVQRIDNRDRVYPLIGLVKQQQQAIVLPNLMKSQMEDKQMYPVDFTEIYGPQVGVQQIHFTKWGACDMGWDMAAQYSACLPCMQANSSCICEAVSWQQPALQDEWQQGVLYE
ncbi:hypothetical protein CEUSTIGMA_g5674.t1 [Chlamydomonas eustigma]|uniref:Sialate O-acetylesterase domain-containing protein n=1 Tax=Chlamydomonas eustigma TaxID=1157962 RepID=A0A250X5R2_9CHLO|nr:hypothetical protein CEUSTIGMA_g5674.t1 [Chlamydomonas eustigma]|eukprot:GAX78232.1 hypothetical protein CEUSTIGMA_g5674.t1 [Chlamydomonas eustigma]